MLSGTLRNNYGLIFQENFSSITKNVDNLLPKYDLHTYEDHKCKHKVGGLK